MPASTSTRPSSASAATPHPCAPPTAPASSKSSGPSCAPSSAAAAGPPGLDAIDYTQQQTIACIVPRSVNADINREAILPAARRADTGYLPFGWAFMPDGQRQETAAVMIGNTATLDAVTNAIGYQAAYYPLITCWLQRPTESATRSDASYRWELIAEEV